MNSLLQADVALSGPIIEPQPSFLPPTWEIDGGLRHTKQVALDLVEVVASLGEKVFAVGVVLVVGHGGTEAFFKDRRRDAVTMHSQTHVLLMSNTLVSSGVHSMWAHPRATLIIRVSPRSMHPKPSCTWPHSTNTLGQPRDFR